MDAKLKQRLVGAAVLAALIFIVLAVLLKNNSSSQQQLALNAKTSSLNNIQTLNNSNANNNPVNDDSSANAGLNNSPSNTTSSTNNNIPSPENIASVNSTNPSDTANTSNINAAVKNAALNNQTVKPAAQPTNPMSPAVNNNTSSNNNIANKVANNQPSNNPAVNKALTTTTNNEPNNNINPDATTDNTQPIKPIAQTNNPSQPINSTIQNQTVANQSITADNNPEDQSDAINTQANQPAAPITSNTPAITQHHKHKVSQLKNKSPAKSNELIHSLDTMPINNSSVSSKSSHGQKIWAVQVGSFKDPSNANALSKKLKAHQFSVYTINFNTSKGQRTHVYVGAKSLDKNAAEAIVNKLQKTMNMNAILVANTTMPLHKSHVKTSPANKSSTLTEGSSTNA